MQDVVPVMLSEYELERERKIKENKAMLADLGLAENDIISQGGVSESPATDWPPDACTLATALDGDVSATPLKPIVRRYAAACCKYCCEDSYNSLAMNDYFSHP